MGQYSEPSFEEFFAATYGRLVGLLFAFLHDQAQAEDAVQDAFASALLRWRSVRDYHDSEAWVRKVAFRRAIDHHRRNTRRVGPCCGWARRRPCHRSAPSTSTWCAPCASFPWHSGRCWSCTTLPSWRWSRSPPSWGCPSAP